jgi:hypothetical protein
LEFWKKGYRLLSQLENLGCVLSESIHSPYRLTIGILGERIGYRLLSQLENGREPFYFIPFGNGTSNFIFE